MKTASSTRGDNRRYPEFLFARRSGIESGIKIELPEVFCGLFRRRSLLIEKRREDMLDLIQ